MYRRSRTFFTANGGLFVFAAFQPAIRQARMGVAENIREHALEILSDAHGRIGQSPEKPQIFLYLFVIAHPPQESIVNEGGINYNYVNLQVPPYRDHPCWFVSFDTRARDL